MNHQSYLSKKSTHPMIGMGSLIFLVATLAGTTVTQGAETSGKAGIFAPVHVPEAKGDMLLWYRQPGEKWLDASPLGNGLMGAMVFGGIQSERIALNDSSFWSGRPHDYDNPEAPQYFPKIRDLVASGQFQEAEKMADDHFFGVPKAQQAYQPLGDLLLSFDGIGEVADYRRELDMENGVVKVTFRSGDTTFTREVFVSYPDRVMAVRLSSSKPGKISVEARFKSPFLDKVTPAADILIMDGCWKGPNPKEYGLIAQVEGTGLKFRAALQARFEGGQSTATTEGIKVQGADTVTFLVTTATSYVNYHDINGNPALACSNVLNAVREKNYADLKKAHETDFRGLMGRVHLKVGDPSDKPIDERLKNMQNGNADANLEALCFQFGRYILASSSRAGGQPANLQGIWNEETVPPWGSKYTININTEMNYWPAEVCNLSECHQPLFDMLKDVSVTGAKTARLYYGCSGWVTHHNIDLWRGAAPVDAARYGMWPVGGAWLCQHLWEHYAFTGDQTFLREYYPILKGSAQFLLEVMIEEPKHHWLVTPFSMSPEHGYIDSNGKLAFLSPSPTMDIAIIRELFPHCIEASKVLNVDAEFRTKLEAALTKLPPYQINHLGHLQEWIEDWKDGGQGHNVSPNFTFYPGSSITLRGQPPFAKAIQNWMEDHPARGGFILSWDIAVWARLERGDKVGAHLQTYLQRVPALNLHNAGANQSDASYGYSAAVAEALLQSHAEELSLLPALPPEWRDGSITGLKARGGYEVNMSWKDGKLTQTELINPRGGNCKLRLGERTAQVTLQPGKILRLNTALEPVTLNP